MTTPRPHKNVPQTGNTHLISHKDPGRTHTSSHVLLEKSIAKSNGPCSVKMVSSFASIGRPIATQTEISVKHRRNPCESGCGTSEISGPACENFNRNTLSAEISKFVVRLVRHYDQHEREMDGAVHWNSKKFLTEGCISNIPRTSILRQRLASSHL